VIGFARILRLAALAAGAAALVAAGVWIDAVLGAGHLVAGLVAGALLAIAAIAAFLVRSQRAAATTVPVRPPPLPAELVAAYDWSATALDGSAFPMEQLRGEVFVLNVWSTLCAPCLAELPTLDGLHELVKNDGVRVLCVATDADGDRVRRVVSENGWRVPVLLLGDGRLPPVFDSQWIPATYVVSADGRVVYHHAGAARWDHPRVLTFLRALSVKAAVSPSEAPGAGAAPPRAVPGE
jgi:thiol-disulfide isomerase/thioredoxin